MKSTILIALVLSLGACSDNSTPATSIATVSPPPSVSKVGHDSGVQDDNQASWLGIVLPRQSSDVSSKYAGHVKEVRVRLGDRVEKGAVLAVIDGAQLRGEVRVLQAALRSFQASQSLAKVDLDAAHIILERERRSFSQGTSAKVAVDKALTEYSRADANLERSHASVQEQKARITQLRASIGETRLLADFAGVVAKRNLDPGSRVRPGQPILRIVSEGETFIRFAVPAKLVYSIAPGDALLAYIEVAKIDVPIVVDGVAPGVDSSSQMLIVEASIQAEAFAQLKTGLVARVRPVLNN